MELIILTNQYPTQENKYRNGFVHQRVKAYLKLGHTATVLILSRDGSSKEYTYENTAVKTLSIKDSILFINKHSEARLLIHFINKHIIKVLENLQSSITPIIWFHGVEGLHWKRRLFEFKFNSDYLRYIIAISVHLYILKRFLKSNHAKNYKFVFVSQWMRNTAAKDLNFPFKNHKVIPNFIDTKLFSKTNIDSGRSDSILLLRHFGSKKYANDLSFKAIRMLLSDEETSNKIKISIYGEGKDFIKYTKKLKNYSNVAINNEFLSHKEVAFLHKSHGIFLCPTRQDSQGVSMCEAMSSGLVPITSNNTAIPEFVDSSCGFLTNNTPHEIYNSIRELISDKEKYESMSINARNKILDVCSFDRTILEEIVYIKM